jgi:hypothetical protein
VRRTAEAHSALARSGAEECGCEGCQNFDAVRPQLLQGPLGAILKQLGVSPPWDAEGSNVLNGSFVRRTALVHIVAWPITVSMLTGLSRPHAKDRVQESVG